MTDTLVCEGWWHPNTNNGRVHDHPDPPGRNWSIPIHRLCEPVYTNRGTSGDGSVRIVIPAEDADLVVMPALKDTTCAHLQDALGLCRTAELGGFGFILTALQRVDDLGGGEARAVSGYCVRVYAEPVSTSGGRQDRPINRYRLCADEEVWVDPRPVGEVFGT